jgi:cobalt-zinc-cadmium efflux system outer membrane protein
MSAKHKAKPATSSAVANTSPPAIQQESPQQLQQVSAQTEIPADPKPVHMALKPTSESLSLPDAVSYALGQNPSLVALRQTEHVGVAACGVANTYPFNPLVQVQATPYQDLAGLGQGSGTTYHYVLLMQRIQLAHQQQYREDVALSSLNGIRWNIHQAELQAISLTTQLYFTVLYQRGILEIAKASQDNNKQLLDVLEKRFQNGDVSAADVATVRVDSHSTRQQLRLAESNYQTARRDLLRQLGLPPDSPYDFAGDLRAIHWKLPLKDSRPLTQCELQMASNYSTSGEKAWITNWAAFRPDVLTAHSNIDIANANLCLASANRVPDVQLGPYYQRGIDSTTFLGFRGEMNLPIHDTGRPMENQRYAELKQQTTIWRQTLQRAELEVQAAFERYELAYQTLSQETAENPLELPVELQSLERQFRSGEVDVVRVIQARTSILQNQRARLDLLNELAQSSAILVGATGMPLESLVDQ